MFSGILGNVGIPLNFVQFFKERFLLPVLSHWNLSRICPAHKGKENSLFFLTHGVPHLLFLSHKMAELQDELHLSALQRKLCCIR